MKHQNRAELVELGLSPTEAQIYLALLEGAALSASAIATTTGLSRTAVYQILCALTDKGLVESGAGYGSKFAAVAPERALPALIAHEEEELAQRKKVAETLSQRLALLAESTETAEHVPKELIQVIRNPRAVAERYNRLRLEADRSVEVFVKAPIFVRPGPDPILKKLLRRGVLCRGLYEQTVLDAPAVAPYLASWIADGNEVRVYNGSLPHKLAIFDRQSVFVHLKMPGDQMRTVFIRHQELAMSFGMLFDSLWHGAQRLDLDELHAPAAVTKSLVNEGPNVEHTGRSVSRNGRRGQPAKK